MLLLLCSILLLGSVSSQKTCTQGQQSGSQVTSSLVKSVLASADANVRPDADYGGPTMVEMDILIMTLEPTTPSGYYHMHGVGIFQWTDQRLAWNPDEWAGIKNILLPASGVWQPDLVLYNSYSASPTPKNGGELPFPVNVSYTGVVTQRGFGDTDSRCVASGANIACTYLAGGWSSDSSMLMVKPHLPLDSFALFQTPAVLTPLTTSAQAIILTPGCCSAVGYSVLNLTMTFANAPYNAPIGSNPAGTQAGTSSGGPNSGMNSGHGG